MRGFLLLDDIQQGIRKTEHGTRIQSLARYSWILAKREKGPVNQSHPIK